jgi:glycosyltransferase involved in cell wall biosynthesis
MKYAQYVLKRKLEGIFIYPFILLGRSIAFFKPLAKEYKTFFFFPFYHTGGAEKVHALITQSVGSNDCMIFFTRKSSDKTFLKDFQQSGCTIKDISAYTDNKWLYFFNLIYRGIVTGYINQQKAKPIVFNGQCNFGYKISPWVKEGIKQVELIHALNSFSWIRIPFAQFYTLSITVSDDIVKKHLAIYKKIEAPAYLDNLFSFVESKIKLPQKNITKDFEGELKVLYVGRATPDKRVHIAATTAEHVHQHSPTIEFHFAGDVEKSIPSKTKGHCILHGDINEEEMLNNLYDQSHILIVTSSTESGPLVILEAMARGLAILTTDVGFAPNYIQNGINGFKIKPEINEQEITALMSAYILELNNNRSLLKKMSELNTELACKHFGIDQFHEAYKSIFNKLGQ